MTAWFRHWFVRLLDADTLETMASAGGLRPRRQLGNYRGNDWQPGSPRTILVLEPA